MNFFKLTIFVFLVVLVTICVESKEIKSRNKRYGRLVGPEGDDYTGPKTQFIAARVKSGSEAELLYYNNGMPGPHRTFVVCNFGQHPFRATSVYGSGVTAWKNYIAYSYAPGLNKSIPIEGNLFMSELQVRASNRGTSLVYAYRGFLPEGYISYKLPTDSYSLNINGLQVLGMFLSKVAMKFIPNPFAAIGLSLLVDVFFQQVTNKKEDPWKEIEKKVDAKIEAAQAVIISTILDSDLRPIREQIMRLQRSANSSKINNKILYHIESTAAIEFKFTFPSNKKLNYHVLPLYSQVVNLKLSFMAWCLRFADQLGLDEDDVESITNDRDAVVNNAVSHVYSMYAERNKFAYEECDMSTIYDCVMGIRTHITMFGLDYIPAWQAAKKGSDQEIIIPTAVSYSNYFGRASGNLFKQLFVEFGQPPLTPEMIDAKTRAKLIKIVLIQKHRHIVGMKQYFDNGKEYILGYSEGYHSSTIELGDARILKLTVKSEGAIGLIGFHLSDGRELWHGSNLVGAQKKRKTAVFELKDHFISSLYVANDQIIRRDFGVIINIACSFMLIPELTSGMNLIPKDLISQEDK